MELQAADIKEGQIFYGVKLFGECPEFKKYKAVKATAKQVKANSSYRDGWAYESTLRSSDWRYFSDFTSAREAWIEKKLDKDISLAEQRLQNAKQLKLQMLEKDDI